MLLWFAFVDFAPKNTFLVLIQSRLPVMTPNGIYINDSHENCWYEGKTWSYFSHVLGSVITRSNITRIGSIATTKNTDQTIILQKHPMFRPSCDPYAVCVLWGKLAEIWRNIIILYFSSFSLDQWSPPLRTCSIDMIKRPSAYMYGRIDIQISKR